MIKFLSKIMTVWVCWHTFKRRHELPVSFDINQIAGIFGVPPQMFEPRPIVPTTVQRDWWSYWIDDTDPPKLEPGASHRNTEWKNGSEIEILSRPAPGPFGFNPVKLHYDEIDLMPRQDEHPLHESPFEQPKIQTGYPYEEEE